MHAARPRHAPYTDGELSAVFAKLGFVSNSPGMSPLLRQAWKASQVSDATLLIEGETGSGKQVLAEAIHRLDPKRNQHSLVTVHCGSVQETLIESELFGHERGSFSGAVAERRGLFQTAHGGTLFLDDVNDLPLPLQPKLLDVLQRGRVRPVGADREQPVDVRIIAACNHPLAPLVRDGKFRADLFYRLEVIRLEIPPLRERPGDLAALILTLAGRHQALYGPIETVDGLLIKHLGEHPFQGNVRELEHAVQRMLFDKADGAELTMEDWLAQGPGTDRGPDAALDEAAACLWNFMRRSGGSYADISRQIEGRVLKAALAAGQSRREIAAYFQISERNLYRKLRAHGIGAPSDAGSDTNDTPPDKRGVMRAGLKAKAASTSERLGT